jgi:hypothetical protein
MASMRIPKYTAGMFKKKMPRFGASSIKMPRMPKAPKPRAKKYDEGGEVEEIIIGPGAAQEEYADEIAQIEERKKQNQQKRRDAESKDLVKKYYEAKKKRAEINEKNREKSIKHFTRNVRTARTGGKMDSCCRGDGVAQRGKTRGKFV